MSLYYEAASVLAAPSDSGGSLKSRIYRQKNLKSSPSQIYALVVETLKWNTILNEVIENSQLLHFEKKLTPQLALLLVHDQILSQKGIAAAASHPLRSAIKKHKSRLRAEFTKIRVRRKFPTDAVFKQYIDGTSDIGDEVHQGADLSNLQNGTPQPSAGRPRWVRINTLRTTLQEQLDTTFARFQSAATLMDLSKHRELTYADLYHADQHIPNLIALPARVDITGLAPYRNGRLILQNKASCFPGYLLTHELGEGDIIDACAAPGNKTTHIASLLVKEKQTAEARARKIWAIERDAARSKTLQEMVARAGVDATVSIKPKTDFLDLDPADASWKDVSAILLDPSCSGSGIVGRDDEHRLILPSVGTTAKTGKKRKRGTKDLPPADGLDLEEAPQKATEDEKHLAQRLVSLAAFQQKILTHAFRFESARRVVYSTCSLYPEENEHVVSKALNDPAVREKGWRILRRNEQPPGLRDWNRRGHIEACQISSSNKSIANEAAEACIRCYKGDDEGTMGFFVAGFIRDWDAVQLRKGSREKREAEDEEDDTEWEGLSD